VIRFTLRLLYSEVGVPSIKVQIKRDEDAENDLRELRLKRWRGKASIQEEVRAS
jgi:hypothetical protein